MPCEHDKRFHLMGATNGCCACGLEEARAEVVQYRSQANDSWDKYQDCAISYRAIQDRCDALKLDLQTVTKSRDHYLKENAALHNWQGRVTDALVVCNTHEIISSGRAMDLIAEMKHAGKRDVFRVKQFLDARASPLVVRCGICYSFFDYFDVHWDDGEHQMDVVELSAFGIYKTGEEEG